MSTFGTRFLIQDLHRLTLPYRDTSWPLIIAGECRTAMPMGGIMVSPVGRLMSAMMMWLSDSGEGNMTIAARINQIDVKKTSTSTTSESVSMKYSLKKRCKSALIEGRNADESNAPFWKYFIRRGHDDRQCMHDEITLVYFGATYFIYMFRLCGLNMLMFASRIVGISEVKLRRQLWISQSRTDSALPLLLVAPPAV